MTYYIEHLKQALELIRQGIAGFEEYCTEDCEHCPLYKADACGYHMELVPNDKVTDTVLDDFIALYDKGE